MYICHLKSKIKSLILKKFVSNIYNKSGDNLSAAILLKDSNKYAPCVHCAYFSSFQLMKYVLKDFFHIDYITQERELNQKKKEKATKNIGVHEYIIYRFGEEVHKISSIEYRFFNNSIKDLKNFRVASDYKDIPITYNQAKRAVELSELIHNKMKEKFHI